MARRVLEMMRHHANERRQFGKPIGEFQMVQQMIADSATEIFATRMMVLATAAEIDQGIEIRSDKVSMVKLYASEMLGRRRRPRHPGVRRHGLLEGPAARAHLRATRALPASTTAHPKSTAC